MTAWPLKNVVTDPNLPDALANARSRTALKNAPRRLPRTCKNRPPGRGLDYVPPGRRLQRPPSRQGIGFRVADELKAERDRTPRRGRKGRVAM